MTDPPLSLAFFDSAQRLHGTLRSGVTLLFEDSQTRTLPGGPEIERAAGGFGARVADEGIELSFAATGEPVELSGARVTLCRVEGSLAGRRIACLGTATETLSPPAWADLDAVRGVSAVFDESHAAFAIARRPRGARGHGDERVSAVLLAGGEALDVEDARISTVYDGDGRQRTAGLELWLPGEDFPRRASGSAQAGASLSLEGLRVNAAVFGWRMEGRDGAGAYELAVREEREAA